MLISQISILIWAILLLYLALRLLIKSKKRPVSADLIEEKKLVFPITYPYKPQILIVSVLIFLLVPFIILSSNEVLTNDHQLKLIFSIGPFRIPLSPLETRLYYRACFGFLLYLFLVLFSLLYKSFASKDQLILNEDRIIGPLNPSDSKDVQTITYHNISSIKLEKDAFGTKLKICHKAGISHVRGFMLPDNSQVDEIFRIIINQLERKPKLSIKLFQNPNNFMRITKL